MKSIYYILIILALGCNTNKNYSPQKLEINSDIRFYNLELENNTNLFENDSIILSSITDCYLDRNNKNLILATNSLRSLTFFDYNSGDVVKQIKSGLHINQNFAESYTYDFKDWNDDIYEIIDTSDYFNIGYDEEFIKNTIVSDFRSILYEDYDKLEILTYIMVPAKNKKKDKRLIQNLPLNVVYNKNNNEISTFSFYNFKRKDFFPLYYGGIKINNDYYIPSLNQIFINDLMRGVTNPIKNINNYELISISKHDSLGNFTEIVAKIPISYINSQLFHEYLKINFLNMNDTLYFAYHLDDYIYKENDKIAFKLKNLPYSNIEGMKHLGKLVYSNRKLRVTTKEEDKAQLCPISIIKLFNRNDNLMVLVTVYEEEHPLKYYYILQEYRVNGELLTQTYFDDDPYNPIKNIFYDAQNDYLCFLRKSKQGWSVEKRSFK